MNRHSLSMAWHAATDMSALGWGTDCIQFKLSHKRNVTYHIMVGALSITTNLFIVNVNKKVNVKVYSLKSQ